MSSKWTVRKGLRTVKNVVFSYTEVEKMVRTATSNEPWGASEEIKLKIADATYDLSACNEVMKMLWKRVGDLANWRHVYKGVVLLEYLCRAGSDQVVADALEHVYDLDELTRYQYINEDGTDVGGNVRKKAQDVAYLLRNKDILWRERDAFRRSVPPPTTRDAGPEPLPKARSRTNSFESSSASWNQRNPGAAGDDGTQADWDDEHTTGSGRTSSRPLPPLPNGGDPAAAAGRAGSAGAGSARGPTQSDIEPWLSKTLDPPQAATASRTRRSRRNSITSASGGVPASAPGQPGGSSSSGGVGGLLVDVTSPAGSDSPHGMTLAVPTAELDRPAPAARAGPPRGTGTSSVSATASSSLSNPHASARTAPAAQAAPVADRSFPSDFQEFAPYSPPSVPAPAPPSQQPRAASAGAPLARVSSLYQRELELMSALNENDVMLALSEDMRRTELSDVFHREQAQRRIQGYGWKALRKLWGTGDCAVLLSIVAQRLVQGRITYEEAERTYGTREVNVDADRRALLQWLYNNGSKYPAIMDGLLMEALDAFPNESTDQVAYLKYITKMAKSHQYLSIGELAGGAYRDNYVLVILRENQAQTGLELSGMVAPPEARRAIYALFGDEAHYSLLEPLRAYSPAQASIFSQAPPALQPILESVYAEQQAPRSAALGRRASWQLRPMPDRRLSAIARTLDSGTLITTDNAVGSDKAAAYSGSSVIVSPPPLTSTPGGTARPGSGPSSGTGFATGAGAASGMGSGSLWEKATPLVSLDELGKHKSSGAPAPARGRPTTGMDSLDNIVTSLAQFRSASDGPAGLPAPLIPAPAAQTPVTSRSMPPSSSMVSSPPSSSSSSSSWTPHYDPRYQLAPAGRPPTSQTTQRHGGTGASTGWSSAAPDPFADQQWRK